MDHDYYQRKAAGQNCLAHACDDLSLRKRQDYCNPNAHDRSKCSAGVWLSYSFNGDYERHAHQPSYDPYHCFNDGHDALESYSSLNLIV